MLELCGSKNYPYLPHRRDLSLDSPPPPNFSGNSSQASYIYLNFGDFENPPPQELPWGGVWIFSGTIHFIFLPFVGGRVAYTWQFTVVHSSGDSLKLRCLNPLSPNIHIQILQTDLHTFP